MVDLPNNNTTTAEFEGGAHVLATFSGELESFGDKDWIRLRLQPSVTYQFFGSVESAGANAGRLRHDAVRRVRSDHRLQQ